MQQLVLPHVIQLMRMKECIHLMDFADDLLPHQKIMLLFMLKDQSEPGIPNHKQTQMGNLLMSYKRGVGRQLLKTAFRGPEEVVDEHMMRYV